MHTRLSISFILMASAAGVSLASCNNRKADTGNVSLIAASNSIPQTVKSVVAAIAANDSDAFASLVSYPLARPYPLHHIDGPEEMKRYFSTIVDDSLRNFIVEATPDDWKEFGWRGWSVGDGSYIWINEDLSGIPYVSSAERKALDSLRQAEIGSLAANLRGGWTPVACLRSASDSRVMRIDEMPAGDNSSVYRLAVYESPASMRSAPTLLMTGTRSIEGSACIETFSFSAPDGTTAFYQSDFMDGSTPTIDFSSPSGSESTVEVIPDYWLSLLPPV